MKVATLRDIRRMLGDIHIVVEVTDARAPDVTRHGRLEELVSDAGRRLLVVINKSDLVPEDVLWGWVNAFRAEGLSVLPTSATKRLGTLRLRKELRSLATERLSRILVVGFPKVGKSSIINVLKGRRSASVSAVPGSSGYTRHFQLFRVGGGLYLVDSPGILPPEGTPLEMVLRGAKPEVLENPVEAAVALLDDVMRRLPGEVSKVYGVEEGDPVEILTEIARRKNLTFSGTGEPNLTEAARHVIRDYHLQRLRYYRKPPDSPH